MALTVASFLYPAEVAEFEKQPLSMQNNILSVTYLSFGFAKRLTTRPQSTAAIMPTLADEKGPLIAPKSPFSITACLVPL